MSEVPETSRIERAGFADKLPRFDRLLSGAHLFERAERHFRRTRRFLELNIPDPPAIMHWTYPIPVRLMGSRNLYTLHDLVPLKLPFATLDRKRYYHRLVERCVREGDHIVTVSESSRRDIIDLLGAGEDQVTNTYQHTPIPDGLVHEPVDVEAIFGVKPQGYFLFFGAIEPKKNVARMVEAYLSTDTPHPLVLVGASGWQKDGELRLVDAMVRRGGKSGARIIQLEYLPRRLLMHLARHARAVLFPSLYEGFGLPVLEAMQLGTPVVTSNRGSLPEVAGDAALIVDPYDVSALARAIARVDRDAEMRALLSQAGLQQASRFSLSEHRRKLHALYTSVLASPPR
ncbi:glycosyltransferase family 1 protein [Sphingomonas sp. OV641]|uniref:glycosyltransferase family 4 protein n=1 Tax=Sphingomonas sp. OV641 TaxID=1881068 RepID=UPI00210EEF47|nr:glycosyltransferase family 1 protein [Sphingomonas sp. OV641]